MQNSLHAFMPKTDDENLNLRKIQKKRKSALKPKENTKNIAIQNKVPIIEKAKTYLIPKTKEKEKEPEQKPKNIKINPTQEKPIKTNIVNNNYRIKPK